MDGQTNSKTFTRVVLVGLTALAFLGIAVLFASGRGAIMTEQGYAPGAAYAQTDN